MGEKLTQGGLAGFAPPNPPPRTHTQGWSDNSRQKDPVGRMPWKGRVYLNVKFVYCEKLWKFQDESEKCRQCK